jgi:hypothetical protein
MPSLSQEQIKNTKLRSGVSTCKVVALVVMSQFSIAHLRKDVGNEIDKEEGVQSFFHTNRRGVVSLLLLNVDLELHL